MKLVVLDGYTLNPEGDNPWTPLEAFGQVTVYDRTLSDEEFFTRATDAEILIVNKTKLDAERLARLPNLRCICVAATGYDGVAIDVAAQRNIPVMNVPAYGIESVAQHAFALLLELCRHVALHDASVKQGDWAHNIDWCYWKTPQRDLCGQVMGIMGFGNIGRRVGALAHAFGMRVIAHARHEPTASVDYPYTLVDVETLFAQSDVISLHCPLTEQTRHLVNATRIATMKKDAIIINTARGALLDEQAVANALHTGALGGLGTDVLSIEPATPDNPLCGAPNTLITPHIAWASLSARRNIIRIIGENIEAWLSQSPKNVVNFQ